VVEMAYVTVVALISVASLTALAQPEPSWTRPYLRVYPPVSANENTGGIKSLYFALMMSFAGDIKSSGTIPGVEAALDGINSDPTLLPGYKLHYTLTDSQVRAYLNVQLKHLNVQQKHVAYVYCCLANPGLCTLYTNLSKIKLHL